MADRDGIATHRAATARSAAPVMAQVEVIAPHIKRRLSGVTSTVIQLVPIQARSLGITTIGPGLPDHLPKMRWWQVFSLLRRPRSGRKRIWHARRNIEMLAGLVLKSIFRAPLSLVFTSAGQRDHTRWTKFLIRHMDAVIATSSKAAAYLKVPSTVVMHGVDTDRFTPPKDKAAAMKALGLDPAQNYVGCFGRVRHQKGVDLFVDAMIELLPSRPGWSAVISGRTTVQHAEFEQKLKDQAAAAGLAGRILFVGEVPEITPWFGAMSLYIAPQRWEGFGLTPLEAMSSGVPVVATDVGAFSELIVEGVTGNVVDREDLPAIVAAAGRLMDDEAARKAAADAALQHARTAFPLRREADGIRQVYDKVWAGQGA
jgi:mannosyltransferase